jgi:general secretion pathway protein D
MRRIRTTWIVTFILLAALPALGQATSAPAPLPPAAAAPIPAAAPAPTPAAAPASKPAAPAATSPAADLKPAAPADNEKKEEANIRLQFEGTPFNEIIRRFCQTAKRPLVGDLNVEGTLTFFDAEPYTYHEAMDLLNVFLAMRGWRLMEDGRYLKLVQLAQVPQMPMPILQGMDNTQDIRPNEVVTMVLPLKFIQPDMAMKTIVRMVSAFGSVSPLTRGKGIIITDTLANIKRIQSFLGLMDIQSLSELQARTIPLKKANAGAVAEIINRLFGQSKARDMVWNAQRERYEFLPADPREVVNATADERTNLLLLMGGDEKLAMAEQMVLRLDQDEGEAAGEMRVFELKKAKAEDIANVIRQSLSKSAEIGRAHV